MPNPLICPDCGRPLPLDARGQPIYRAICRSENPAGWPVSELLCRECWQVADAAQQAAQNAAACAAMRDAGVPTLFEMENA